MADITEAIFDIGKDLASDWARFGSRHLQHAIGMPGAKPKTAATLPEMPKMPEIPPLNIPPMPESLRAAPAFASIAPAATAMGAASMASALATSEPASAQPSPQVPENMGAQGKATAAYGDEWEDLSIACAPCTIRHLSTMKTEIGGALKASGDSAKQLHLATWASEGLVWIEFDVTPEKLQRARSDQERMAIAKAAATMGPVLDSFPTAPRELVLAWGAIAEAQRFGRNAVRTERDEAQVNIRMREVNGWVGSLDTHYASDPRMQGHLDAIRKARHNWTREGYTPAALVQGEQVIREACVAMTPVPDDATIQRAYEETRAARDAFFADIAAHKGRTAPAQARVTAPVTEKAGVRLTPMLDVDTRLPQELAHSYLQELPETERELLGATPETQQAFENLLRFQRARGLPVREENLPPVVEGGEVEGVIEGAYYPSDPVVWLSPAATSEAPHSLFTLVHESAHSVLHSPACQVYRDENTPYGDQPTEHEANAAAMLALIDCGLPMETDTGRAIPPQTMRADLAAMERRLGAKGLQRVQWAAGVLAKAIKGDPNGAAQESGACPR